MRFLRALALALLAPALCAAQTASQRLDSLAKEATERSLDLFPVGETFGRGPGPRQDRLELTFTAEHRERQRAHQRWLLGQLEGIPLAELGASEKLTHELLGYRARTSLEWLSHPVHRHYLFIQLNGGVAFDLVQIVGRQPFRNAADYRAWFRRVQRYPAYLQGIEAEMREGMRTGVTTPRVLVQRALPQLEALMPEDPTRSTLWQPMTRFPKSIDDAERKRLEAEYRKLLEEAMFPAMRRLAAFVRGEYLPQARTTDGFGALPGGAALYQLAVRSSITAERTPEAIHQLGLREVKRIQAEYLAAAKQAGYSGTVGEVSRALRDDPKLHPFASGDEVIAHLDRLHARIVPQLPKLFARLPRSRFEIRLTDAAIAASAPAQYHAPARNGSRPGVFAMPVVNARRNSTFGLEALLAHEGMPGHHLETSFRVESQLPEFRRGLWLNAYGEGWALYAEALGQELGLYDEPLALLGRYSGELYRAGRLVVDTGLHAKGWTRQQAIRYLVDECGSGENGATTEVLRYMAWPGQALGYKIGEMTLLELRAKAEQRLGTRFDIRAFHEAVLEEGQLPLSTLEQRMAAWIEARLAK